MCDSGHHNILVVDDNRDAADTLAMLLRYHGHDVRIARDGREGIEEFTRASADVVLLDIGLPFVNGYDVCRRMRAMAPDVKLIAMTGYGQEQDRLLAMEAGFDEFMVKPASIADVLGALPPIVSADASA